MSPPRSPEDDLAFMRSIVEGGGDRTRLTMGVAYLAGGLLYGLQCLFHWGQMMGVIRWPDPASLAFVVAITMTFLVVLIWAIRRDSKNVSSASSTNRGINAAFGGAGLANMAMVAVFAINAVRMDDIHIWLFYPAVVFVLQGAAWYVAWMLRRRGWMLAISLGWTAASVGLGLLLQSPYYLAVCVAALFGLMALPGWIMVRQALADR